MYICHVEPLSTHHVPSAGCSSLPFFFFLLLSKKPLARGFPILPRVLFLQFGDEKSSKRREMFESERSLLDNIPQKKNRVSVREQGQSLTATPHDTDTQISSEDHCPGSACVFALLLQIHGHTFGVM